MADNCQQPPVSRIDNTGKWETFTPYVRGIG